MARPEGFHHCTDGRGSRRVYVNGNEIERVVWCDTNRGIVVFYPYPYRINRGLGEVYTRRLRGSVTVKKIQ
jgi:hypothetical protein